MKGISTQTGEAVESRIQASFSRETFILSYSGLKMGPTMRGVPSSEKNTAMPLIQVRTCSLQRVLTSFAAYWAKDSAPPECSIMVTHPPMATRRTMMPAL